MRLDQPSSGTEAGSSRVRAGPLQAKTAKGEASDGGRTQMGSMYYWRRAVSSQKIAKIKRDSWTAFKHVPEYQRLAGRQRRPQPLPGLLNSRGPADHLLYPAPAQPSSAPFRGLRGRR